MQSVRKGFRDNGGFLKRGLESRFIRNRNAERGFRQNGIPEAMRRIGGKAPQRLIGQSLFQRFPVFVRGNMPHDDAQIGIIPLRLKRLLNAAVRTFEIRPVFKDVALKTVHRPVVQAGSAGKCFQRRVGLRQIFGDLGFDASLHGQPIRCGRSGVGKDGVQAKAKCQRHSHEGVHP